MLLMLPDFSEKRKTLLRWAQQGLAAVEPRRRTRESLAGFDAPRCAMLAVGKAAPLMSKGAFDALDGRIESARIVAPASVYAVLPEPAVLLPGDHPVPGKNSLRAGVAVHEWLESQGADLPLLVLLSGGGSALLELPVAGLSLADLQRVNEWLLGSGLDIHHVNTIRARFSTLKRGGLLRLAGNRTVTGLVISDVPGDRLEDIASGPLSAVETEWPAQCVPDWLQKLHERLPLPARNSEVRHADVRIIARNADFLDAVTMALPDDEILRERGTLTGDAAEQGRQIARSVCNGERGVCVFGGETTVRLPGNAGKGGRNQHLALAAAIELAGREDVLLLALGTDGIDGNTDDAGALVDGGTVTRMRDAGIDAQECLVKANSNRALAVSGDIINTGPTGANVSDVVIAWKF